MVIALMLGCHEIQQTRNIAIQNLSHPVIHETQGAHLPQCVRVANIGD